MISNEDRYLKTDSLYLAAYVFARGAEFVGVTAEQNQAVFTFVRTPECELWRAEFQRAPEALIDARKYLNALRTLQTEKQETLMRIHAREDGNTS